MFGPPPLTPRVLSHPLLSAGWQPQALGHLVPEIVQISPAVCTTASSSPVSPGLACVPARTAQNSLLQEYSYHHWQEGQVTLLQSLFMTPAPVILINNKMVVFVGPIL